MASFRFFRGLAKQLSCLSHPGGLQAAACAVLWGGFAIGCDDASSEKLQDHGAPALVHSTMASTAQGVASLKWTHIPVPAEDGPQLAPAALVAPVMDAPQPGAEAIGYLRLGEKVARSPQPVSRAGCPQGWYAVRPIGFVCDNDSATVKMDHPLVRAFPKGPDTSQPMPYSYGFLRAVAPNYLRVPDREEQLKFEMRLERHLRNYKRLKASWDHLESGANQVPLTSTGAKQGKVAPQVGVPNENARFGGDGDDAVPWWLETGRKIPNVSTFRAPSYAVIAGRVKRHAGVALVDTFVAGQGEERRRFAVAVDGRLIPADKIKADGGSRFAGAELGEHSLPVAFPWREGARLWTLGGGAPARAERVALKEMIPLSGRVRTSHGVRFVETKDGKWLRSKDAKVHPKPSKLPWFAKKKTRWIDIGLLSQTLVLYEGSTPIYATLISSGRDGMGDPQTTLSTPTGTFRIYQKHVTTTMDSNAADNEFELRDVPWVMYFKGGYALHAAYWHDDFGRARSHGCVNLSPIDARYIFNWASPDTPEHWHGSYAGDAFGSGTLVHIHG